ncbi:hypothetical protein D0C36_21755 [Mucilaginibacter conchicola]|uniref:Teneurin NHL domain-containing protein n=1 Tax=Mucilaginibacter conchicola TaxID=2303333 RepID=A0A372NP48_9SPHI|nr:hypothetical protein [Mucilaginibacter conchicola]RFZ90420.1 hypothetical protein D0C36_21755 [Mucilaginibacter conchicola]
MSKKLFVLSTCIILLVFSCKNTETPDPVKPGETTIDKTLLTGWWEPTDKEKPKIYFGDDNFFYQNLAKDIIPVAGFWQTSNDVIKYSVEQNGTSTTQFKVTKLTATTLEFQNGNTKETFSKVNLPAITTPAISTIAGTGVAGYTGDNGSAKSAQMTSATGVVIDKTGNIFFCDRFNRVIRKISAIDGKINTIAGTGNLNQNSLSFTDNSPALSIDLFDLTTLTIDDAQNLYVTEAQVNRIDKITTDGKISCVAGCSTQQGASGDGGPAKLATFTYPHGLAVDAQGNLYIASDANGKIRKISNGIISTIAGTGAKNYNGDGISATSANIMPFDISITTNGDIYFTEIDHNRIRKITAATGIISTVAGTGVSGNSGDNGPAINAQIIPFGIKALPNGDIYFTDLNNIVRKVNGATGIITTIAGTGYNGYTGDGIHASAYSLADPFGITTDTNGNLYIAERNRIRKVAAK